MNVPACFLSFLVASAVLSAAAPAPPQTAAPASADSLAPLAAAAIAGDTAAITKLRAAGPPGLEAVLKAGETPINALRANKSRLEDPANARLRAAIDSVARQRDAFASGLYWFTDFEAAKAEAKRTNRPILSLRLLGNLDDEFSCANSRFFRTSLYANRNLSALLRRGYVLHWKSVRPVPVLTIDMGDGRRIKRTITGNSIHYVLDSEGRVLDALPGNYSPVAFIAALLRIENNVRGIAPQIVRAWHGSEADALCREWLRDAVRAGMYGEKAKTAAEKPEGELALLTELFPKAFPASSNLTGRNFTPPVATPASSAQGQSHGPVSRFGTELTFEIAMHDAGIQGAIKANAPDMAEIITRAPTVEKLFPRVELPKIRVIREFPYPYEFDPPQTPKGMVERPILNKAPAPGAEAALDLAAPGANGDSVSLAHRMTNERWAKLAEAHRPMFMLDLTSRRFMMAKLPAEMLKPREIESGWWDHGSPFQRMLDNFEAAIARDMVRNEYYFHTLIHQWLEEDEAGTLTNDVEALNKRVYAELFLTPDYDEWLGLVPEDTYTALEKDGCACDKNAPPMNTTKRAAP